MVALSMTTLALDPPSPCRSMLLPMCSFVPMLPDLDHDIDLTTPQPGSPTDVPPPPSDGG
jgi:hypothetical protein